VPRRGTHMGGIINIGILLDLGNLDSSALARYPTHYPLRNTLLVIILAFFCLTSEHGAALRAVNGDVTAAWSLERVTSVQVQLTAAIEPRIYTSTTFNIFHHTHHATQNVLPPQILRTRISPHGLDCAHASPLRNLRLRLRHGQSGGRDA
jgi:hypothetical protein